MGCGIGELRCLSELGGELKIFDLQNVRNKEEAQGAKMVEKKKLQTLRYEWVSWREGNVSKDEEVLEGLEPHSNLKSLTIENYNGEKNPSWLVTRSSVNGSPPSASFHPINLVDLNLLSCRYLKNLPTLGVCTNLKFLKLAYLNNVKSIGKEFYSNNSSRGDHDCVTLFPALEKFSLIGMREVREWVEVEPTIRVFPSLKELTIVNCDNLSSVPTMRTFSSLETLIIRYCKGLNSVGHGVFPSSLKQLKITACRELRSIPGVEGGVSLLQVLEVRGCDKLSTIEGGLLASTCLRDVEIKDCPNLISIPSIEICSSHLSLNLAGCGGLSFIGDRFFKEIKIEECRKLRSIPSVKCGMSSLQVRDCDELSSIGDGVFSSSLTEIIIQGCRKLRSVSSVKGGISSLQALQLRNCDELSSIGDGVLSSSLKEIKIKECRKLRSIPSVKGAISSLQVLQVREYDELSSIGDGVFSSSLKEIKIERCRKLGSIPIVKGGISSLQVLQLRNCDELSSIGDGVLSSSLKEIKIKECRKLRSIPSVEGGISFLQLLHVERCDELSIIEEGLLASTCLTDVYIANCPNLVSIGGGLSATGTRLEKLTIEGCPNLISIPSIECCSSLLSLWLHDCKGLTSLPTGLQTCTSLQRLCILNCSNLKSFPDESLGYLTRFKTLELGPFSEELEEFPGLTSIHHLHSSLEELTLIGWKKLSSVPHQLQHLTNLKELNISLFHGVQALPEWLENLSNLKRLGLGPFSEELEEFPHLYSIHHLRSSLEYLKLVGWDKLSSLPYQIQHITALGTLVIRHFNGVEALPEWLGNLCSLHSLQIQDCENLEQLPSNEAMQGLSNLQRLSINGCPRLEGKQFSALHDLLHFITDNELSDE